MIFQQFQKKQETDFLMGSCIFLFAHQDDEVGIISLIKRKIDQGANVICVFATDGGKNFRSRNKESLSVLNNVGVKSKNILFVGKSENFMDGYLSKKAITLKKWLIKFFLSMKDIDSIYVTAYEGGHQDHDALHHISVIALNELNLLDKLFQFPLYNKFNCLGPFFSVLKPLSENGKTIDFELTILERLKSIIYCLYYPSQYKTWIGLLPFFIMHHIFYKKLKIQKASIQRLSQRPHDGALLYESRGFYTFEKIQQDLKNI